MIHQDRDNFFKLVDRIATKSGFSARLMEKDYYLTLILSKIPELSQDLVFKGGTCLNKMYYAYYRLSEDLDFSMRLPAYTATRGERRKTVQPVKEKITGFAAGLGLRLQDEEKAGRNESKQYIYNFVYDAVTVPAAQTIKLEIGLRFDPILEPEIKVVQHRFMHPFTGEPLFDAGSVKCLALKEIVAEKMRAASLRKTIAPRDFYDLGFILRNGFELADPQVMMLFMKKVEEDGGETEPGKYRVNMGRTEAELKDMRGRVEAELFDVLTGEERKNFDLDGAIKAINEAMAKAV